MKDTHTFDRVKSDSDYSNPDPVECISDAESRSLWENSKPVSTQQPEPEREPEPLSDADEKRLEKARCLVADLMPYRFDLSRPRHVVENILSLNGIGVGSAGNLLVVSGQAGCGKSRIAVGGILASTLGDQSLGWSSGNPKGHAVIHVDCEQSLHHWEGLNHDIARRSGTQSEQPDWLLSWTQIGVEPGQLCERISELFFWANRRFGGIRLVVIDGFADLLNDPNSLMESTVLTRFLHGLAEEYQTLICGVLHTNQASENFKTRGHLGSQLERKAESILTFNRNGEVINCFSVKTRNAPITRDKSPRWQWSDESHGFELLPANADIKRAEKESQASEIFEGQPPLTWAQATSLIQAECNIENPKSAETRLLRYIKAGVLFKDNRNRYSLAESNSEL
ncbi:MAG: AAA family ATPase [Opitutales bacterium]|nr:AAA family ATPase [Opitutales bacterium]